MVFSESAKIVINKIQKLDPENASKIIGYLLLQDDCEQEMLQWALCSETQLLSLVNSVKAKLRFSPKLTISAPVPTPIHPSGPISDLPLQFTSFTPALSCPFSSPATFPAAASSYWDPQLMNTNQQPVHTIDFVPSAALYGDLHEDDYCLHNQAQFLGLEDQMVPSVNAVRPDFSGNYYHTESQLGPFTPRMSRRSPSLPEFPFKVCHYFNKGYCKHGKNCRYSHDQALPDSFSPIVSPGLNDLVNNDHIFSSDSLEELELELTELLRSRKGMPVSIASLPMLYYEKYGKTLQADGYLTESQRHGKAGYSLTKLLARLKNSIRVIDRAHGQHSVVLAEDAPKYMENRSEKSDPGEIVVGSRQIYLTFPAESTFTEDDVSNYFKSFGPVQDVRIPCQQKRMFGFVTFLYPETVKSVLTKGNPHFVCDSRVLVKPYREKSRLVDRKYTEKIVPPMYFSSYLSDMDGELNSVPRVCRNSRLHRKQLIEEQEQMLELQRLRLSELHFAPKQLSQQSCVSFPMEESKVGDHSEFNFLFDILNNGSTSDNKAKHASSNYSEPDSQELNLPESPFASAIASSISTVI